MQSWFVAYSSGGVEFSDLPHFGSTILLTLGFRKTSLTHRPASSARAASLRQWIVPSPGGGWSRDGRRWSGAGIEGCIGSRLKIMVVLRWVTGQAVLHYEWGLLGWYDWLWLLCRWHMVTVFFEHNCQFSEIATFLLNNCSSLMFSTKHDRDFKGLGVARHRSMPCTLLCSGRSSHTIVAFSFLERCQQHPSSDTR